MRFLITLKDGAAIDRAAKALADHRYALRGDGSAPDGHPERWREWLLEIDAAELDAIRRHVRDDDIVEVRPLDGGAAP